MTHSLLTNSILYIDEDIIIINKPPFIPVHYGRGGGENLEQHLGQLCFGNDTPPMLAHRLDRNTSGCLILGRNKQALNILGRFFMSDKISKTYWAVVEGNFEHKTGTIDHPLRRKSPLKHLWWMEAHPDGKESITDYKVMGEAANFTFLELKPKTGRTHQLRVHCQAIGHPIIGDDVYGTKEKNTEYPKMHLHARSIEIPAYNGKPPISASCPPPEHMLELLQICGLENQ